MTTLNGRGWKKKRGQNGKKRIKGNSHKPKGYVYLVISLIPWDSSPFFNHQFGRICLGTFSKHHGLPQILQVKLHDSDRPFLFVPQVYDPIAYRMLQPNLVVYQSSRTGVPVAWWCLWGRDKLEIRGMLFNVEIETNKWCEIMKKSLCLGKAQGGLQCMRVCNECYECPFWWVLNFKPKGLKAIMNVIRGHSCLQKQHLVCVCLCVSHNFPDHHQQKLPGKGWCFVPSSNYSAGKILAPQVWGQTPPLWNPCAYLPGNWHIPFERHFWRCVSFSQGVTFSKPEINTSQGLRAEDIFELTFQARNRRGAATIGNQLDWWSCKIDLDSGWSMTQYDLTSCHKLPLVQDTSKIREILQWNDPRCWPTMISWLNHRGWHGWHSMAQG